MTDPATTAAVLDPDPLMPEVLEAEDGDPVFFLGHIHPAHARIAVAIHATREWGHSQDEAFAAAVLCAVDHEWLRVRADDDERMDRCKPTDDGATAFTIVRGLA